MTHVANEAAGLRCDTCAFACAHVCVHKNVNLDMVALINQRHCQTMSTQAYQLHYLMVPKFRHSRQLVDEAS